MSYTFEQNMACATSFGNVNGIEVEIIQDTDETWYAVYAETPDAAEFTYVPLEEACATFGTGGVSLSQDPVGWTFEGVTNVIDGVGSVVGSLLGIFGLGPQEPNNDYSDPNALQDAQKRQQLHFFLGFAAILGLILAGVYYSRKK